MSSEQGTWNPPGRSLSWRIGMAVTGLIFGGVGVLVLYWPQIIVWAVACVFLLIGAFLVLSAALARSGGEEAPEGVLVEAPSEE